MYLSFIRFCFSICSLYRKIIIKQVKKVLETYPNLFVHVTPTTYIFYGLVKGVRETTIRRSVIELQQISGFFMLIGCYRYWMFLYLFSTNVLLADKPGSWFLLNVWKTPVAVWHFASLPKMSLFNRCFSNILLLKTNYMIST